VVLTYDIGDIIGIEGEVFKTRHGEVSIKVDKLVLLSKSLQLLRQVGWPEGCGSKI
jgi:lysyl-tRNA synthetase class 2